MVSHTSPDAVSSRSRHLRIALIGAVLLTSPLAVQALRAAPLQATAPQVYVWRDAGGAVHFSQVR